MANTVNINVRAKTAQATSELEGLKGKLHNISTSEGFKSVAHGVGMGAGIAAFNMLGSAISQVPEFLINATNAAIDEEAQIARLTAALAANVKGWDGNIDAVERRIDANKKMAFSDDEQRDALTKLLPVTQDVNQAFEAQAAAMNLARLKNISLEEAAGLLAKAFNGQMRGLKDLGINTKEVTTRTEILGAVQEKAGGQAEAFAESHAGAAKRLGDAWADFGETVGGNVLGAVDDLSAGLEYQEWRSRKASEAGGGLLSMLSLIPAIGDAAGTSIEDYAEAMLVAERNQAETAQEMERLNRMARDLGVTMDTKVTPTLEDGADGANDLAAGIKAAEDATRSFDKALRESRELRDLPLRIQAAREEVRLARKALEEDMTNEQKYAAELRLRQAEDELVDLQRKMAASRVDFNRAGWNLGDAYGQGLWEAVKAWNERTWSDFGEVNPKIPGSRNIDRLAAGGRVRPGEPVIVGEFRPEVFVPDRAGTVLPGVGSSLTLGAGAIVVNAASDPDATARAILLALRREVTRQGMSLA